MVVSYTNNYGYTDAYARQPVNNMTTNPDGGGNGGGGAFFKMFEEKEAEEINKNGKEASSADSSHDPLDDLYKMGKGYYASPNVLKDYIDNSMLINTEQVACTNITQHLALKNTVKESLNFLNIQAAKNMVATRKNKFNKIQTNTVENATAVTKPTTLNTVSSNANFFENRVNDPHVNFFMKK